MECLGICGAWWWMVTDSDLSTMKFHNGFVSEPRVVGAWSIFRCGTSPAWGVPEVFGRRGGNFAHVLVTAISRASMPKPYNDVHSGGHAMTAASMPETIIMSILERVRRPAQPCRNHTYVHSRVHTVTRASMPDP